MNILGILNAFSQGSSGGDKVFLQVLADNKNEHITILTSHLGKLLCEQSDISADYIVSSHEKTFSSPITTYLKRIYVSLFLIRYPKEIDQIITASDSLPDTIPAFLLTGRGGITWTTHTYHIVPWGRLISRLTQELSIFLMGIRAST
ncbi:hypothetical protein KBD81_03940, partial [Candidatus Woesebacteria bacterium]|nr:hypothetical protein [Candidatus Woesebacteria bacterium]